MENAADDDAPKMASTDGLDEKAATSKVVVSTDAREITLVLVAGEHSGDALGARLMSAIRARRKGRVRFLGVGGEQMQAQGLASQFPLSDVAVMGPLSILPRLPRLINRVYRTVDAALAACPDAVVIIDSPEFTHPIAKRIRRRQPDIPIIDYVSPSVWAWRPGRAAKMKGYVDHVLALLPFEPEAHERLGGPPCTYVGHPLIERVEWIKNLDSQPLLDRLALAPDRVPVVVLPGSRASEVSRLMAVFGETLKRIEESGTKLDILIPAVPHLRERVDRETLRWPGRVHVLDGDEDKFRAFRIARAALAASGTVTLELALSGTPMVVAYRVDAVAARLRFLVNVPSVVLANLVLGEQAFPEFLQEDCTADKLAVALGEVLSASPTRDRQLAALERLAGRMFLPEGTPSDKAADIVLDHADRRRKSFRSLETGVVR
jgi:lipid-A-disaccharide synthase